MKLTPDAPELLLLLRHGATDGQLLFLDSMEGFHLVGCTPLAVRLAVGEWLLRTLCCRRRATPPPYFPSRSTKDVRILWGGRMFGQLSCMVVLRLEEVTADGCTLAVRGLSVVERARGRPMELVSGSRNLVETQINLFKVIPLACLEG